MDDLIWCSSCGQSASLSQALLQLPCSSCGSSDYFVSLSSSEEDALLSLSERMQRVGDWSVAEAAFRRCFSSGLISAADLNMSLAQLSERRDCAAAACDFIRESDSAVTVSELRAALMESFDRYTVTWLLSSYSGLSLVPFGSTYIVEVS